MLSNKVKPLEPSSFTGSQGAMDEFKPFEPTVMREVPKEEQQQRWVRGDEAFRVKSSFWESLLNDRWMQKELEKTVQDRVEERCKQEAASAREQGKKEGLEQGHAAGEALGKQKADAEFNVLKAKYVHAQEMVLNRMNELSLQVIQEKRNILEEHGRMWSRALAEIVQKVPMSPVPGWEKKLSQWLEMRLDPFLKVSKINVSFSAEEYEKLMTAGTDLSKCAWQLLKDETLKSGEVRVECTDGGLFFSKSECADSILDILTKYDGSGNLST